MKGQKVKRLNINIEMSLHDAFKAATAAKGENMTDALMQFIRDYVDKNGRRRRRKVGADEALRPVPEGFHR